jgi:hypothetical protein
VSTLTQAQIASALAIPAPSVSLLARNVSFPRPTSAGGILVGDSAAVTTFQTTLWAPALARGWKPVPALLPSFSFTAAAVASPGPAYRPEAATDPTLLDF